MLLMHVKSFQSALISCMPLLGVGTSWGFLKNQKSVPPALVLALYDGRGYVYRYVYRHEKAITMMMTMRMIARNASIQKRSRSCDVVLPEERRVDLV